MTYYDSDFNPRSLPPDFHKKTSESDPLLKSSKKVKGQKKAESSGEATIASVRAVQALRELQEASKEEVQPVQKVQKSARAKPAKKLPQKQGAQQAQQLARTPVRELSPEDKMLHEISDLIRRADLDPAVQAELKSVFEAFMQNRDNFHKFRAFTLAMQKLQAVPGTESQALKNLMIIAVDHFQRKITPF